MIQINRKVRSIGEVIVAYADRGHESHHEYLSRHMALQTAARPSGGRQSGTLVDLTASELDDQEIREGVCSLCDPGEGEIGDGACHD
jgi:hypothetical protein